MTMLAPIMFRCDLHHRSLGGFVLPCAVTLATHTENKPEARRLARASGWLHLAGFDFCPEAGKHPNGRNHVALMRGHRPVFKQVIDPFSQSTEDSKWDGTWSARCRCKWEASQRTVHPAIMPRNGLLLTKGSAVRVWMEAHVRVDVEGLDPMHTAEQVANYYAEMERFHAGFDQRAAERKRQREGS